MTETEALYGFFNWIASSKRKYRFGGGAHGGDLYGCLAKFCEENNLPYLEDGWEKKIKIPRISNLVVSPRSIARKGYRRK